MPPHIHLLLKPMIIVAQRSHQPRCAALPGPLSAQIQKEIVVSLQSGTRSQVSFSSCAEEGLPWQERFTSMAGH